MQSRKEFREKALKSLTTKFDLRSPETSAKYQEFLKANISQNCIYCDRELFVKKFKHWIILVNRFPYDKIGELSHMLSPKRHISGEENLSEEERLEYIEIKKHELEEYDMILESTPSATSRPDHFHVHLLRYRRR